jgi:DNA polymerase-1
MTYFCSLQLELRILAHLANCRSMLDAFKAGGDFHSRTAMNMYQHIRDAVEEERVLLEWDPQPGQEKPPVPMLKVNPVSIIFLEVIVTPF